MLRDTYSYRQFLYCFYGSSGSLFLAHSSRINIQGFCYIDIFVKGSRSIELHDGRKEQSICYAMRYVEYCTKRVSHAMNHTEANIRECHSRYILSHSHSVSCISIAGLVYGCFQITVNHFYGLYFEHVAHFPCVLGYKTFYGMSESVKTRRSCQAFRKGVHQFCINNSDGRNIVRVYANHLLVVLLVGDYIVDGYLGCSTGSSGKSYDRNRLLLRICYTFKRNYVTEFRIVCNYTYSFGCVH